MVAPFEIPSLIEPVNQTEEVVYTSPDGIDVIILDALFDHDVRLFCVLLDQGKEIFRPLHLCDSAKEVRAAAQVVVTTVEALFEMKEGAR